MQFLDMFKDTIFVSIAKTGGYVLHTKNIEKMMAKNMPPHNEGAYFTVNGFANFEEGNFRGRTKMNVTSFNASFLDIDLTPETRRTQAEFIYMGLKDTGLTPTAVVLTGKGLHIYWIYKEPAAFSEYKLKEYEILQTAIVEHFKDSGADKQARDAARVLRVPGAAYFDSKSQHTCDVELMYFNPDTKYEPIEIAKYFKNSVAISTDEGLALLKGDSTFDLSGMYNVKKGGRHHMAYSTALSLIQRSKSLADARELFQAAISTWESAPNDPLDIFDCWKQFDNAVKMLEKDRPNLFGGDAEHSPITMSSFEDMPEEKLEWLWDGFLIKGKAHILAGMPGLGKSQITIDIASRISTGKPFPSLVLGAPPREPMGVVILSAEDGAADTIKPRLIAAGANMKNVYSLKASKLTKDKNGKISISGVTLKEDAERILEAIKKLPVKVALIIIDPATAFLASGQDSNSNSDVRGVFAQLQSVIMDKGISMLLINHLNKNTSAKSAHMRSIGSTAWTAVARATFYCFWEDQEGEKAVFSPDKLNLAKKQGKGFFYRIKGKDIDYGGAVNSYPYIEWDLENFPTKTTDEYMSGTSTGPKKDDLTEDLEMYMQGRGPVKDTDVIEYMKKRGYTAVRVYRAARLIGIIGDNGIWQKT